MFYRSHVRPNSRCGARVHYISPDVAQGSRRLSGFQTPQWFFLHFASLSPCNREDRAAISAALLNDIDESMETASNASTQLESMSQVGSVASVGGLTTASMSAASDVTLHGSSSVAP